MKVSGLLHFSRRHLLTAVGALSGLVLAAVVLFLALNDGEPQTTLASTDGLLFVNGSYVPPPYTVESQGGRVIVNGATAFEFSQTPPPPAPIAPPSDPANAAELARVGAAKLDALGWPQHLPDEGEVTAIAAELAALPVAESVIVEEGTLLIRDRAGGEERLLYWVRPAEDEDQSADLAASMASAWERTLSEGGVLIVAGGASLSVPANAASEFNDALVAALDGGADRSRLLADLIGSPSLEASLAQTSTPDDLRQRVARSERRVPTTTHSIAYEVRDSRRSLTAGPDPLSPTHYDSRTPSSRRAYIMAPVVVERGQSCAVDGLREATNLQSYSLYEFWGEAATMEEMLAASGKAGIYNACQHGGVSFGPYSKEEANRRVAELRARGITGIYRGVLNSDDDDDHYVGANTQFLSAHWRDAGTIVIADMCAGAHMASGWGAREFIGSFENISTADTEGPFTAFWQRMSGALDEGEKRAAGDAFDASFPSLFSHSGHGAGRTVLTPGVRSTQPEQNDEVAAFSRVTARVTFDAFMNPIATPRQIMTLEGPCNPQFVEGRWVSEYVMEFTFDTGPPGFMVARVDSPMASSSDDLGLVLDGNLQPRGSDHQGPNYDDYELTLVCVEGLPTSTPTTALDPRTPTPTQTPVPTDTPTVVETPQSTPTPQPTTASQPTSTPQPTRTPTPVTTPVATQTPVPTAAPTPVATPTEVAALPPVVGPIVAELQVPVTYYSVEASSPSGLPLTYSWRLFADPGEECGTKLPSDYATPSSDNHTVQWSHANVPPDSCHHEAPNHPFNIEVTVSDGVNPPVIRMYRGSNSGVGSAP